MSEEYVTYLGARPSAPALEKLQLIIYLSGEKIAKTYHSLQPSSILEKNRCNSSENVSNLYCMNQHYW